MAILITYVFIALGFSFLCSLLEASLLSVNTSSVFAAKQRGEAWAEKMVVLKEDVDKPLSAILTLNTIAHTMGAAGAGAQYAKLYKNEGEAMFAAFLTLAILVFTEIIPKTLGARYSLFFAKPTAHFLPILQWILGPLVWMAGLLTKLITFGGAHGKIPHREVLMTTATMGEEEGELAAEESKVVRNVLRLSEMSARDIMTPRSVMFMIKSDTGLEQFIEELEENPFSRVPLYEENRDNITGVVLRSEALLAAVKNRDHWNLDDLKREVQRVSASDSLDQLMRSFLNDGHHFSLVTDKYGTVTGLLTLEDILETVVGVEIMDESDEVADLQALARQLWKDRAIKKGLDTKLEAEEDVEAETDSQKLLDQESPVKPEAKVDKPEVS